MALALDHVAVCVADLDAARRALEKVLGPASHQELVSDQKTETVFFDLPGCSLELVSPRGNEGLQRFLAKRGDGLHHLAVRVDSVAERLEALRKEGVSLIDAAPRPGAHGSRVAFVHPKSAAGVLLELVERE